MILREDRKEATGWSGDLLPAKKKGEGWSPQELRLQSFHNLISFRFPILREVFHMPDFNEYKSYGEAIVAALGLIKDVKEGFKCIREFFGKSIDDKISNLEKDPDSGQYKKELEEAINRCQIPNDKLESLLSDIRSRGVYVNQSAKHGDIVSIIGNNNTYAPTTTSYPREEQGKK